MALLKYQEEQTLDYFKIREYTELFVDKSAIAEMSQETMNSSFQSVDETKELKPISIISWNYDYKRNGLSKEKIEMITKFAPDILIVQECSGFMPVFLLNEIFKYNAWYQYEKGNLLGVGVFSNLYDVEVLTYHNFNIEFRYIIPFYLIIENRGILLFVVWTNNYYYKANYDKHHNQKYLENIDTVIDYYDKSFEKPVILIGDFNSGDSSKQRRLEHIKLVKKLKKYNIFSCTNHPKYVAGKSINPNLLVYNNIDLSIEPTYYHNYDPNQPYINDYCFFNNTNEIKFQAFGVGIAEKWINYSDHFPLWMQFAV